MVKPRSPGEWAEPLRKLRFFPEGENGLIRFSQVFLPPAIENMSVEIPAGSWVMLYGEDDFAKALFCDLCFSYIQAEKGIVSPNLKPGDVSFLGRSNTTYGKSLIDHLGCGVKEKTKDLFHFAIKHVLSPRFHRNLAEGSFEFLDGKSAVDTDLDERDFLEIAEANVLLQKRKAVVIDTSSDFYQIGVEQGFRHSNVFLNSGKTLIWIISAQTPLPQNAQYWNLPEYQSLFRQSLSFPGEARAGYLN